MSVIPLTTEGPERTVVQSQSEFDIEGRALLIQRLDVGQLDEPGESNVSYDLRIGKQCRDHREQIVNEIGEKGTVTLRPGSAIIIQTEESVHLPRSMFGSIAPRVSLLELGLSSTYSKVDPGYRGHLLITLFNLGKATVTLPRCERFCAITIHSVGARARLYEKGEKQITAKPVKQPRRSPREYLEEYHIFVTIALVIATMMLALATFFAAH